MANDDYSAHVDQVIGALAQDHALGRDIDIAACVCGLEAGRVENRKVREFVVKTLKINGKEFDRALHREAIKAELGGIPRTARQFVETVARKKNIRARYNGVLRQDEPPYIIREDGQKEMIPPHLWESLEFKTMIRTNFKRTIGFAEFQQALRVQAAELRLEFAATAINDASEVWYTEVCRDRLWQIMGQIDYAESQDVREDGQAALRRLVENCFDCAEGVDFGMAVFNKFIWQVKRKAEDLPITDHLMMVILGIQGNGKSTLIRKLLDPIDELWAGSDFRQITDDRNIMLWRNYAIFLDEMGGATKSDMDIVKNIITAETLTRRPMRSNLTQEVPQNATLIGAANATELSELIRDHTGIRRFVSLTMCDEPDHKLINHIDWVEVWQSVDQHGIDPMLIYKSTLSQRQESERMKTPAEDWLDSLDEKKTMLGALMQPDRKFSTLELHTAFREFEDARFPGFKSNLQIFTRALKKLSSRKQGRRFACELKKDETCPLGHYVWTWVRT